MTSLNPQWDAGHAAGFAEGYDKGFDDGFSDGANDSDLIAAARALVEDFDAQRPGRAWLRDRVATLRLAIEADES